MCGFLGILDIKSDATSLRSKAVQLAKRLRHRGPDWSGVYSDERAVLAHERLAIVDVEHGAQPLIDLETKRVLAVNGEIYNHLDLRASLKRSHEFQTKSDCEVLLYLYDELGSKFLDDVNGIFAFVIYDPKDGSYTIARDHIGIVPLYWGRDAAGRLFVASEMKAIVDSCVEVSEFPPGHIYSSSDDTLVRYYDPNWRHTEQLPADPFKKEVLAAGLEAAVKRQMMCDVPYGLLISGGLDSSIIAALVAKHSKMRVEANGKDPAWWPQVHSFAVGLQGSPDLKMARKVADHIKSIHHEVIFTVQEGIDALRDVIYHLETFDITSIRAATPMYLMARKIRAMGIKMILSGEGSDEIFGGYLYFHKAPNAREFYEETVRKLENLHLYDCLRANKAMAAWGVEARVPFLDREFIDIAMNIDPNAKMIKPGSMEKQILREAFIGLLPEEVLWRQKEQFSDGVGYSWIDSLRSHAETAVTDDLMAAAKYRFPVKTPLTKEGYFYRSIFDEFFPGASAAGCVPDGPSIACSTPTAIRWDAEFAKMADPSGRAIVGVHGVNGAVSH
jgi:asparagine synthase (glutamine-hydrolysing)